MIRQEVSDVGTVIQTNRIQNKELLQSTPLESQAGCWFL